jgi:hypothetical protein
MKLWFCPSGSLPLATGLATGRRSSEQASFLSRLLVSSLRLARPARFHFFFLGPTASAAPELCPLSFKTAAGNGHLPSG